MKDSQSILVVVPSGSSQTTLKNLVPNSMKLGKWMKSKVHFLADSRDTQTIEEMIGQCRGAQGLNHADLIIHANSTSDNLGSRMLEMIEKYFCDMVILTDGVLLHPLKGIDERRLLELSPVPVLLIPKGFDFDSSIPSGFIVPLSGERKMNEALSISLRLAERTQSVVDLLHVMPEKISQSDEQLSTLCDQLHHEYKEMPERIASEASPYSSGEERSRIRRVLHCTGFVVPEIERLLRDSPGEILSLEWKGTLADGRASIIKEILQSTHYPILLVKTAHEEKSMLRVGKNLRAA
jgi:hypothetical protein